MDEVAEFFAQVKAGEQEIVRRMLVERPALASAVEPDGVSALLTALYYGQEETARVIWRAASALSVFEAAAIGDAGRLETLLDEDRARAYAYSSDGWTGLHLAAFFGRADAVQLLLEHGADPSLLSRNAEANTALHAATAGRRLESARRLLDGGAQADARTQSGHTPLHLAAQSGDLELLNLLLGHGARPDSAAEDGLMPLDLARREGHAEAVTRLDAQT
jgi:ankyrin repeat protein